MTLDCKWQPIDTAPRHGTAVLLFHPAWDMLQVGIHYAETTQWQDFSGDLLQMPTHWMALPPPPREQAGVEVRVTQVRVE